MNIEMDSTQSQQLDHARLRVFACRVLDEMRDTEAQVARGGGQAVISFLLTEALDLQAVDPANLAARLLKFGVSAEDLVDFYIPEVARRAGEMWVQDTLTFAEVTLVGSRMYALCKQLASPWIEPNPDHRINVLVAIAPAEQHMLGAVVLACQLRRQGCAVRLLVGQGGEGEEVIAEIAKGQFDAVFVSCANGFTLDNAERLVSEIRANLAQCPRLIIGGAISEKSGWADEESAADLRTSDLRVALADLPLSITGSKAGTVV